MKKFQVIVTFTNKRPPMAKVFECDTTLVHYFVSMMKDIMNWLPFVTAEEIQDIVITSSEVVQ